MHAIFECPVFNATSINDRLKTVNDNKLCLNCLQKNHILETHRIENSYKKSAARHHTWLYIYQVDIFNRYYNKSKNLKCPNNTHKCHINFVIIVFIIH